MRTIWHNKMYDGVPVCQVCLLIIFGGVHRERIKHSVIWCVSVTLVNAPSPVCVYSRLVEDDAKTKSKEPADAAALIAEALKRKFAHRHRNDSERDDTEEFKIPVIEAKPQKETIPVRNVDVL